MGLLFKTLAKQRLPYKRFLVVFLLMALIGSVANVLMTRLTGDMGQAAVEMDMSALLHLFVIFTAIMIVNAAASALSALLLGRFAGRAGYRFRETFVKYFLQKPFAAFESTKSGESLSVFSNDLPASVELVSGGGVRMIADIINLLVLVAYLLYLNWWLSLIFFAAFPVLIVIQSLIAQPIQKKREKMLEAQANVNAVANDSFQNIGVVIAYSLENVMEKRCRDKFDKWIAAQKSWLRSFVVLILAGTLASIAPLLIIVVVSARQVIVGNMNIAEWIAFTSLAGEAGSWLAMLSQRQNQVKIGEAGAKRMDEHMTGEPEDIYAGSTLSQSGDIAISAENLKFSYGADAESGAETAAGSAVGSDAESGVETAAESTAESAAESGTETAAEPAAESDAEPATASAFALDDVSFEIKKGSRVAFVGGSGSGKSTVLKLLIGLYTPQEGKLSVMGSDSADVSLQSLRDAFAYVQQDSFLFPETISENITGESTVSDRERLEKACRDAGILEFIESLPEGFDAILNESAENVSGGQKQRIALARAFYRDAPIILFDEATSALDPSTEAAVLQSFHTLAKDKTVVMVAHRPKAVDFCDAIVVMDSGKIAAIGTHDELIKSSVVYAKLCDARSKGVPA